MVKSKFSNVHSTREKLHLNTGIQAFVTLASYLKMVLFGIRILAPQTIVKN